MSGIYGFLQRADSPDAAKARLQALKKQNAFYGRDGSGERIGKNMGLGCALEHLAACPMGAALLEKGGKCAVIDALLYNREELIAELNGTNDCSDEELLFDWIGKKGLSALARVNGDFAGSIYDASADTLTLFRDHFGVRPIYWYLDDEVVSFATDYRGILAMPGTDRSVNEKWFYLEHVGYNSLTRCETEFARVRCVHPGSYLEIRRNDEGFSTAETLYWEPGKKVRLRNDDAYIQELRRLITDSVRRRLDVLPGLIGAELSGGLDSGVIDLLIGKSGRQVYFVSWSMSPQELPLKPDDERCIVQEIADAAHAEVGYVHRKRYGTFEWIDATPLPYLDTMNLRETAALIHEHGSRVVFTGHGGDEGVSHRCNALEMWCNGEYLSFLREIWASTKGKKHRPARFARRLFRTLTVNLAHLKKPFRAVGSEEQYRLFNPDFYNKMRDRFPPSALDFCIDPLKWIKSGGARGRIDCVAVEGAVSNVRYILPFFDYRVMDFALSIPRRMFFRNGMDRYIYREAFRDILPESLYGIRIKYTVSTNDIPYQHEDFEELRTWIRDLRSRIDVERWSRYVNFAVVDEVFARMTQPDWEENDDSYEELNWIYELHANCYRIQLQQDSTD